MTDIYKAPDARLNNESLPGEYGSLEKGIAGDYEFDIGATISEAWQKTSGAKWTLNIAAILYIVLAIIVMFGTQLILSGLPATSGGSATVAALLQQIIMNAILLPVIMGLYMIGIKRSVNAPISPTAIFGYFGKVVPLLVTIIMMYILVGIGLLTLIIPGIYLMVAYMLAMPLVVEKGLSPWQALEASRKAISKRWFAVLGYFITMTIIVFISAIPLGIGLIWTGPMMLIGYGILYRNIFGCQPATLN